jgi:hypothetical protein
MSPPSEIPIYEQYEDYEPPFDVKRAIERMLAVVPEKYLTGLGSIVLTCENALTGKRSRSMTWSRGKKVSAARALGLYHPRWGSSPAWIELRVDSIFYKSPWLLLKLKMPREVQLGSTFFHELGHHIHAQHQPEFKEKEDVAELWKSKGQNTYIRKRFWYWSPLIAVLRWLDQHFDLRGRLRRAAYKRSVAARSNSRSLTHGSK